MKQSRRLDNLDLSPIRTFSEGAPPGAIPLAIGEPTWDLPAPARDILSSFEGVCRYGPGSGLPELREEVSSCYGVPIDNVMISCGSQGALFSLLQAWLDPGDVVLIPDPGFVTYRNLVRYAGGIVSCYQLLPEEGFRLTAASLLAHLDQPRIKAVIVNHPANPTGAGMDAEDLAEIADACRKRDILLISDEVYRQLYLGSPPPGLRDVTNTGVVVSSVSKAWGAPGLRVGWAVGDPEWLSPARMVHAYAVTSASFTSQLAAAALVRSSAAVHEEARRQLSVRWEALSTAMDRHLQINAVRPDGAFYYWLKLPTSALTDPISFCRQLRDEAGVLVVPGETFGPGGRAYVRLSYAATPDQITEGIRRLALYWTGHSH